MSIIRNVFNPKMESTQPYQAFWNWFRKHEKSFFEVVKAGEEIDAKFFNLLSPKLDDVKKGIFFLTGMHNEDTVELILTPDGTIKDIVFIEELIDAAPKIDGWKFTALKPSSDIENINISMSGYDFNKDNLFFYSNEESTYPDQIDITIVHSDFNEENEETIANGAYIFLDNYIGELASITMIDNISVTGKEEAIKDLIPIEKIKSFLDWREKEFVEKYQEIRHNTDNDTYSGFEAKLQDGKPLVAVINTDLLDWDSKASHPWIAIVEIKYDGEDTNGMPDSKTYKLLDKIEEDILTKLKDYQGYLNIGRQTSDSAREIYFACSDFRLPSKVLQEIQKSYSHKTIIDYDIYKDKYWQSFERFHVNR